MRESNESASFLIVFPGETAVSSTQENSKSSTPGDAKEVQKDAKDFEKEDATETGKMIEEERAETGRVRTLEWSLIILLI